MSRPNIMIDLETVSVRSNAAICSIGAVKFTFEDGIIDTFYKKVDANTCKAVGLHIDKDTVAWWMTQNKEALLELTRDCNPLEDVLDLFTEWYGDKSLPTWGNGAGFDNVVIENAYFAIGKVRPWKYWDDRCYRTIKEIIKLPYEHDGVKHNALDDAIAQTKHLIKIMES
jgi:DNA polymerase III epsilon subunit-like protein